MFTRPALLTLALATLATVGNAVAGPATGAAPAAARIEISITSKGFTPDHVSIKKDQPIVLAFTRKTDKTCAKAVTVDLGDGKKITKELPLDQTVEISATFGKAGELSYTCSMDMIRGVMTVQ